MNATAKRQWMEALGRLTDVALLVYADEQGLLDLRRAIFPGRPKGPWGIYYLWTAASPKEISTLIEAECNRRTHLHPMLRPVPREVAHL